MGCNEWVAIELGCEKGGKKGGEKGYSPDSIPSVRALFRIPANWVLYRFAIFPYDS